MPYGPESSEVSCNMLVVLVSYSSSDDTVVVFLMGRASQVSKEPQAEGLHPIGDWQATGGTLDCLVG